MTTGIPLGFRLRVRNEDDTADLLLASTIVGQNPYVISPPDTGDGQQVDPITGQYTIGSYEIDVLDALVGSQPVLVAEELWNYSSTAAFNAAWPESYFDSSGTLVPTRTNDFQVHRPGYTPVDPDPPFPPFTGSGLASTSSLTGPGPSCFDKAYIQRTFTGLTPGAQYTVVVPVFGSNSSIGVSANGTLAQFGPINAQAPVEWSQIAVTANADGSGNLTVQLGSWQRGNECLIVFWWGGLKIYEGTLIAPHYLVTSVLNDANGRPQLLSKKAFIEQTPDGGTTWNAYVSGYVNQLRLTNALRWRFTIGDTQRTATSKMMFSRCIDPAGNFDKGSCILGGPVRDGFGPLPDGGQWRFKVLAVDPSWGVLLQMVKGVAAKDANGPYAPNYSIGTPTANLLNARASDYLQDGGTSATFTNGGVNYALTGTFDMGVRVTDVASGSLKGVFVPYALKVLPTGGATVVPSVLLSLSQGITVAVRWTGTGVDVNGNAQPAQPSVGDLLDVYAYPLAVSQQAPLHWFGHVVDLVTQALTRAGYTYDATSATAIKTILGPTMFLMLRITSAMSLTDLLQLVFGLFRFSARVGLDGQYVFFTTDPAAATLVGSPIGVNDLRNDAGDVWSTQEATIITSFRLEEQDFALWTGQDGSDRPLDYLASRDRTLIVDNPSSPPDLVDGQEQSWTLPGLIISPLGLVGPTIATAQGLDVAYFGALANAQFNRLGTGALEFHVELLGTSDPGAHAGDLITLNLPQRPVGNVRGGQRLVQVLKRTESPSGPVFEGWDVSATTITPVVPTFTLAASTSDPDHVATVTLTNGPALLAADAQARVEWATGASAPSIGSLLTYLLVPPADLTTIDTPAVQQGTTVWVRMRAESPGDQPSAYTPWQSVTLTGGLGMPTGLTATPIDAANEQLSWTPVGSYDFLVVSFKKVTDTTWAIAVFLPSGSNSYILSNLAPTTAYDWGVEEFDVGPVPVGGGFATSNFTTGSTVPTLAPPTLPQAFVGRRDPTTGQTIIDGTYGLNVLAALIPENIQFEVAVETSVGSGTPGPYTVLATPLAAQQGFTTAAGQAPNDGLHRYLRAKATWPGYNDSTYTAVQSVLPWVASSVDALGTDASVIVSASNPSFPNASVATDSANIHFDFSVAGIVKAIIQVASQAAGDLLTFAGGIWTRLGIGSNGQVLTVVSGAPAWATPSSGGASGPWGQDTTTTTGLTYGYLGGLIVSGGALTRIADGTVALTDNTTNYVQRSLAGVVSANTTGFTLGSIPMAKIVTASGAISSVEDDRMSDSPDNSGTGTRDGTHFLRDDGVWDVPPGTGGGTTGFPEPWIVTGSAVFAAWGDGSPYEFQRYTYVSSSFLSAISATTVGTTAARCVKFRLPKQMVPTSIQVFGAAATGATPFNFAIYRDSDGAKMWDSGNVDSAAGWKSYTNSMPTLAPNTDYWFCMAANVANSVTAFRVFPQGEGTGFYGAAAAPLGGLSIGIAEQCQIAVTAGAFPATMPAIVASSTFYPPIAALVGTAS